MLLFRDITGIEETVNSESWSSWAWSYVPQLLPEEEEAKLSPVEKKQSVFSLGLYCTSATVMFKVSKLTF